MFAVLELSYHMFLHTLKMWGKACCCQAKKSFGTETVRDWCCVQGLCFLVAFGWMWGLAVDLMQPIVSTSSAAKVMASWKQAGFCCGLLCSNGMPWHCFPFSGWQVLLRFKQFFEKQILQLLLLWRFVHSYTICSNQNETKKFDILLLVASKVALGEAKAVGVTVHYICLGCFVPLLAIPNLYYSSGKKVLRL